MLSEAPSLHCPYVKFLVLLSELSCYLDVVSFLLLQEVTCVSSTVSLVV